MSTVTPGIRPLERKYPPITQLVTGSLVLVVSGGVYMASYAPRRPPLGVPIALAVVSFVLELVAGMSLARLAHFAWDRFILVAKWALLAYAISAGMIEYAFVRNHTRGGPLAVVTILLVMFAIDVPVVIAFTVARFQAVPSNE